MQTHGISPKIVLPLIGGILVGAILLAVGVLSHDDNLKIMGTSFLIAAAGHAGIGYAAPAGPVTVDAEPQASDPVVASEPKSRRGG